MILCLTVEIRILDLPNKKKPTEILGTMKTITIYVISVTTVIIQN
jgi:hypothetical protein